MVWSTGEDTKHTSELLQHFHASAGVGRKDAPAPGDVVGQLLGEKGAKTWQRCWRALAAPWLCGVGGEGVNHQLWSSGDLWGL